MRLSQRTLFAILFMAAVVVRLVFHYITDFTADDALITYRYAENLIAGHGFVFNIGEHVLGTTTPLFTFLISILLLFKMSPFDASLLISLICSGLTAVVMYRFAQHLRFTKFSILPALVYILWPRSIVGDTAGLETAFFSLLIISALYFQYRQMWIYSVALATMSAVTRPEGFFLLGLILLYNVFNDRSNLAAYLNVPAIIILPWLTFSYFYFGSFIPSSITGKLALYSIIETGNIWQKWVYLLGWHNPLGWIMTAAAIIGGWWLLKKQNFGKLELIWLVGALVFFASSKTQLFFWYVVPLYPVYILFTIASLPMLADRFSIPPWRLTAIATIFAVVISIPLIYMANKQLEYYKNDSRYLREVHHSIGTYLRDNAKLHDTVAARYIGNTGYYSGLRILDRDGIVTPSANDYNRRGDYIAFIIDNDPEWVVAAPTRITGKFADSPEFLEKYELVKSFGWDDQVRHNLYHIRN